MTLTVDSITLNTKLFNLPFMVSKHIRFDEDPSTQYRDMPTRLQRHTYAQTDQKHNASASAHLRWVET